VAVDVSLVKKNINSIYDRRRAAIYALALKWAANAIRHFRSHQGTNEYWNNQTSTAKDEMFTKAFIEGDIIGWFMSHGVEYGVYLELKDNRMNEAIRPIVALYATKFLKEVRELFS
jgi:hypothetical protein